MMVFPNRPLLNLSMGDTEDVKYSSSFLVLQLILNLNPDLLEAPLASSHLFSNARALARLFTVVLPGKNENIPIENGTTSGSSPFHADTVKLLLQPYSDAKNHGPTFDPILQRYVQFTTFGLMIADSPEVSTAVHRTG